MHMHLRVRYTMRHLPVASLLVASLLAVTVLGQARGQQNSIPQVCRNRQGVSQESSNNKFYLKADVDTVHWGYFLETAKPKLVVPSGSEVTVEMLTHHGGDDYEKLVAGDPAMERVYEWGAKMNIPTRGATGIGDGSHIMTGPIYVCDAEPGDVLQVQILDLVPRKNPKTGKTYGVNAATWWGYQYRTPFKTGGRREVATIYEIVSDEDGAAYAVPDYQFIVGNTSRYAGPKTASCVPREGKFPDTSIPVTWANLAYKFRPGGISVPCTNNQQQFKSYGYPGVIHKHPTGTEDYSIRGKFIVPANLHIGNMGTQPKFAPTKAVSSIPPMQTGGNVDNRRIGVGATMYYPVEVAGALLSLGDAHAAQGDSELDGTAIETSMNARLKITLHKKGKLPKILKGLTFPLLENRNEYIIHGYAIAKYLTELDPPSLVFTEGDSLDKALEGVYKNARDWLMSAWDLTEDQAITLLTVACDFNVHQVVDGNWGMGVNIPKYVFRTQNRERFKPAVVCGSSVPV